MSVSSIESDDSECFICNEKLPEPAISLLDYEILRQCECSAKLHAKCYTRWLLQSKTCPVCRKPLIIENQVNSRIQVYQDTSGDLIPNYVEIIRTNNDNFRIHFIKSFISILLTLSFIIIVILLVITIR